MFPGLRVDVKLLLRSFSTRDRLKGGSLASISLLICNGDSMRDRFNGDAVIEFIFGREKACLVLVKNFI